MAVSSRWEATYISPFLITFIMILDPLWPFLVLPQSLQHQPGSSGQQCSFPSRQYVCSSHQVENWLRQVITIRDDKVRECERSSL